MLFSQILVCQKLKKFPILANHVGANIKNALPK